MVLIPVHNVIYSIMKPPRSVKMLSDHIAKLEKEYDNLQEEVAKGETSNFGKESVPH